MCYYCLSLIIIIVVVVIVVVVVIQILESTHTHTHTHTEKNIYKNTLLKLKYFYETIVVEITDKK